jgi:hypothetical protein
MSKIEKVCSTCRHEPRDENCLGCTFDWKNADGNTHWEQKEPFINKPCVSEQACREDKMKVLEKIKAEMQDIMIVSQDEERIYQEIKAIIDKYMAESEDEE